VPHWLKAGGPRTRGPRARSPMPQTTSYPTPPAPTTAPDAAEPMNSETTTPATRSRTPAPHTTGRLPRVQGQPVRLIASDIDGTILSYRSAQTGVLSPRTVEAFHAAKAAGIVVVLVTGRPVRALRAISETLANLGPVVASNGAVTYDLYHDELMASEPLRAAALFQVKDLIAGLDPQVTFAAETLDHLHLEESF